VTKLNPELPRTRDARTNLALLSDTYEPAVFHIVEEPSPGRRAANAAIKESSASISQTVLVRRTLPSGKTLRLASSVILPRHGHP